MNTRSRTPLAHALGAIALLTLATSLGAQTRPVSERVQYARIVGQDYAFDAPTTLTEGIVTFHLINEGLDAHELTIIELGVGHTLKDYLDATRSTSQPPTWSVTIGMTPTILPHAEAFFTARLAPGRYVLTCPIPAKDGRSHMEKGMVSLLTVNAKPKVVGARH